MADDYKKGSMDITEQERTFAGFLKLLIWTIAFSLTVLVFLALVV